MKINMLSLHNIFLKILNNRGFLNFIKIKLISIKNIAIIFISNLPLLRKIISILCLIIYAKLIIIINLSKIFIQIIIVAMLISIIVLHIIIQIAQPIENFISINKIRSMLNYHNKTEFQYKTNKKISKI
jgi:hypothetical protein